MFKYVARVLPHLRVGGAQAGRGAGEPGGANVGAHAHRFATRYAFAGSGSRFVGGAYLPLTRDIALFSLAFYSMNRVYDLSFTLGFTILKLPSSRGLIFNFHFGKTLRALSKAAVILPGRDCPVICPFRAVAAYISAGIADGVGLDLGAFLSRSYGRRGAG